jgi:hypothetical protein
MMLSRKVALAYFRRKSEPPQASCLENHTQDRLRAHRHWPSLWNRRLQNYELMISHELTSRSSLGNGFKPFSSDAMSLIEKMR